MKAKELAALLLKNPEAEVIIEKYIGIDSLMSIKDIQLYEKKQPVENFQHSNTDVVSTKGFCKSKVILLKTE